MNAPLYGERVQHAILYAQEETSPAYAPTVDPATISDWTVVDEQLRLLGKARAAHERETCRWLAAAPRLAIPAHLGLASLAAYAERFMGLTEHRQTEERARVGRMLAELPVLDGAFAAGELCWSAVREITRIATRDTDEEWVEWAKRRSARDIERAVATREVGSRPTTRPDPSRERHRLSFDVRAETVALFRDLQATIRADMGGDVDDDTLLLEMARRALGGPSDEGRASYQVAVTRCEACGEVSIDAGGQSHVLDDAVAEMVACDSQEIGAVHQGPSPHVGAPKPAAQSIPPAIRRQVLRRDRKRCVVDGCRNHVWLDVHHVDPRAEGGSHDPERLASMCTPHHRAVHQGALCIDGTASTGFTFRHADGSPYGQPASPAGVDVAQQAFLALRKLGFKDTRARALVDQVLREGAPPDLAAFVHAALRAS